MAHMIQCFVGELCTIEEIVLPLKPITPVIVEFPQGLHGLFLSESISEAIHRYKNNANSQKIKPLDRKSVV
jgi:hypothetical protein